MVSGFGGGRWRLGAIRDELEANLELLEEVALKVESQDIAFSVGPQPFESSLSFDGAVSSGTFSLFSISLSV